MITLFIPHWILTPDTDYGYHTNNITEFRETKLKLKKNQSCEITASLACYKFIGTKKFK